MKLLINFIRFYLFKTKVNHIKSTCFILKVNNLKRYFNNKEMFPCEFCGKYYTTRTILKTHQLRAKVCLKLREDNIPVKEFECDACLKSFTANKTLLNHKQICIKYVEKNIKIEYEEKMKNYHFKIFM